MRITAFRVPKPKKFEYTPRFYDPVKEMKEEREKRILREIENEKGGSQGEYRPMSKGDISHSIKFKRPTRQLYSKRGFLLRLITIILALTVALLVFYGTWVLVNSI